MKSRAIVFPLIVLSATPFVYPQTDATDVRVEVSTNKKIYSRGEPVRFRAVLINRGRAVIYISKSLSYPSSDTNGANTPGFEITVRQISGRAGRLPGCMSAGTTSLLRITGLRNRYSRKILYDSRLAGSSVSRMS